MNPCDSSHNVDTPKRRKYNVARLIKEFAQVRPQRRSGLVTATGVSYRLNGIILGACNCDWGCPCNFEAPPTNGICEGVYLWHFEDAEYDGVRLDGLTTALCGASPGPVHEGNMTSVVFADERASKEQRRAIESFMGENSEVAPYSIFLNLTSNFLGIKYVPFNVELKDIHSKANIPDVLEFELRPMTNPVTGQDELATLLKPTGFTSQLQELCTGAVLRLKTNGMSYDHSGQYGEYGPFEYSSF